MKEKNIYEKYHLSTEGYYFKYRHDIYDYEIIRATLFDRHGRRVDDVRVSKGHGWEEKSRHDVINHFEAGLLLNN